MKFGARAEIKEIEFENVTLREAGRVIWFEDMSVKFSAGQSIWIKGEDVSTRVLKLAAGFTPPSSGRVLINGQDIHKMDFEEFLPYRLNLGYTFNLGGILNNKTIKENLMLPFLYHGAPVEFAENEVREILAFFDLTKYQDFRPAGVPGVVRKLCCICRALAITPQVLLMDDPTSSMKRYSIEGLRSWISQRRKEAPILVLLTSDHPDLFYDWDFDTLAIENGRAKWLPKVTKEVANL